MSESAKGGQVLEERPTIFIVRHGEKPVGDKKGVDRRGRQSKHSMTPEGWQRAGALVGLFGAGGYAQPAPGLAVPDHIFAASPRAPGVEPTARSRRMEETAAPLAARLGLRVNTAFGKGTEAAAARAAQACRGNVLMVWTHERIPALAREFCQSGAIPARWPGQRFDLVFVLRPEVDGYRFEQVPQRLLPGDLDTVV